MVECLFFPFVGSLIHFVWQGSAFFTEPSHLCLTLLDFQLQFQLIIGEVD